MDCLGLLIIIFVVFWAVRKSSNGKQTTKPNRPRQRQTKPNQPRRNLPKPNQPLRQSQTKPNQPVRQSMQTGQRQTFTNQTGNTYAKPAAKAEQGEDILARANRNVRMQQMEKQEELKARLKQKYGEIHEEQKAKKPPVKEKAAPISAIEQTVQKAVAPLESGDLMREINDLMVKGYDGEMTFSRDFVAEGIEMLNRIQM